VRSDAEREAAPVTGAEGPRRQEASQHVGVLVRATADASHRAPIVLRHDAAAREDGEVHVSRNGLPLAYAQRASALQRDRSMRPESDETAASPLGHARVNGKNDASAAPAVLSAWCPCKLANGKRESTTSIECGCCLHRAPLPVVALLRRATRGNR